MTVPEQSRHEVAATQIPAPASPGDAPMAVTGSEPLPAGLTTGEAMERLERDGPNAISDTEPAAWRTIAGISGG